MRPDYFLGVVSEIINRYINLDFFIAGDSALLEEYRERIIAEEHLVRLPGWQTNIERVLAAADIEVPTSDNEGTPLSLFKPQWPNSL